MKAKRIIAREEAIGVVVYREGDKIWSLYTPKTPGYVHWLAVAREQATRA